MNNIPLIPPPPPPINLGGPFADFSFSSDDEEENPVIDIDYQNLIVDDNDKKNADYLCPVCKSFLIPDTCVEMKCGHLFCNQCLTTLNSQSLIMGAKCPLCNEKSSTFKLIKKSNKFAYKILCGVKIRCPNKDCKEILLAGNLNDHLKKCEFDTVDCKYCDEKNIYRKDLKKHLTDNMETHFLKLIDEVEDLKLKLSKKNN